MNTKSKVGLHYRILTLVLAIILMVTCVPDLTAFAGDNGGGNSGGGYAAGDGFYPGDSGYRFYIVDEKGSILYSPVDVKNRWTGPSSPLDTTYANLTRLGNNKNKPRVVSLSALNAKWTGKWAVMNFTSDLWAPLEEVSEARVRGNDFRNWMMKNNSSGHQNAKVLIYRLWGPKAYNEWDSKKMYLIVEPIIRMGIPKNDWGSSMYKRFEGTWYGYMKTCYEDRYNAYYNQSNTGAKKKNSAWGMYTFKCALANGFELVSDDNKKDLGLIKPRSIHSKRHAFNQISNQGYGIHIYWNHVEGKGSSDPISTYDIDHNPKKPDTTEKPKNNSTIKNDDTSAGRKNGEVEIVKIYAYAYKRKDYSGTNKRYVAIEQTNHRKDKTGASVAGYFIRKKTTDKVWIKDESAASGFHIWEWRTSKKLESSYSKAYTAEEWAGIGSNGKVSWSFDRANGANTFWTIGSDCASATVNKNPTTAKRSYNYNKTSAPNDYLTLNSAEKALYVMYVKEMPFVNTSTGTGGGGSDGKFNIVKVYGAYDEVTGTIKHDHTTVYRDVTYDVNVQDESGWSLMNWRISKDNPDANYKATQWVDGSTGKISTYGYEDGFDKTTANSSHTLLSSSPSANDIRIAGNTYADVSVRTTINTSGSFAGTIWCKTLVGKDSGGTIYMLFLKKADGEDPDYGIGDTVIPESYIIKRDLMSSRNLSVITTGGTSSEKFTKHKFIWYNPDKTSAVNTFVTGATSQGWTDSTLKFTLDMLNKSSYTSDFNSGILIQRSHARSIKGLGGTLDPHNPSSIYADFSYGNQDAQWSRTVTFKKFVRTRHTGTGFDFISILYRRGDETVLADWKHNSGTNPLIYNNAKSYMNGSAVYPSLKKYGFSNLSDFGASNLEGYRAENDHPGTKLRFTIKYNFGFASGADYTRKVWAKFNVRNTTTGAVTTTTKYLTLTTYPINGSSSVNGNDTRIDNLDQGVKVQVYAGKSGRTDAGATNQNINGTDTGTWQYWSGNKATADGTVSFYPYIKMQTQSDVNIASGVSKPEIYNKGVYVLGQYKRSITPVSYGGIKYNLAVNNTTPVDPDGKLNAANGLINVTSDQWSTHASADNRTKHGAVLPGGATMNISVPDSNRQQIVVESYVPMLIGTGREQVTKTGGSDGGLKDVSALSEIQKIHANYAVSVSKSLESLNLDQWISGTVEYKEGEDKLFKDKINKPVWQMSGAKVAEPQGEQKYYFRDDADPVNDEQVASIGTGGKLNIDSSKTKQGNVQDADLDVNANNSDTGFNATYYTFFTTVNGEVRVKYSTDINTAKDIRYEDADYGYYASLPTYSNATVERLLSRDDVVKINDGTKTVDSLLTGKWRLFNTKTEIVTRLVAAIELGTGNDKLAYWSESDGLWYNEAFDGITYAVYEQPMQVGTIATAVRTAVLDPALTPSSASKGDLFNKFVYSQFKSKGYTGNNGSANKNMIGSFRGKKVYMGKPSGTDMENFFVSDIFYIPNANVQDLK